MPYDPNAARKATAKKERQARVEHALAVSRRPWEHSLRQQKQARQTLVDAGLRNLASALDDIIKGAT